MEKIEDTIRLLDSPLLEFLFNNRFSKEEITKSLHKSCMFFVIYDYLAPRPRRKKKFTTVTVKCSVERSEEGMCCQLKHST